MNEFTRILDALVEDNSRSTDELLPLVYQEPRRVAAQKMAKEAPGQTLQPTALVHEAWLRLVDSPDRDWKDRSHFFRAAAQAMQRILIERARCKRRQKHGGGAIKLDLDDLNLAATAPPDHLFVVNEALQKLEQHDSSKADLVRLRFFVGLTNEQAAQALNVSGKTVKRHWIYARAWLFREIKSLQSID